MLSIGTIRKRLKDRKIGLIAQVTGVHENTIREIRDNPEANPTIRVIKLLSDYLEKNR